jgi:hypothetical protein
VKFLDPAGDGAHLVNPRHVRCIKVEDFGGGARVGLTFVYPDRSEDAFLLSAARFSALEERLQELTEKKRHE